MRLFPWLERNDSPRGGKVERVFGLRVEMTLLELRAMWRRLWRRPEKKIQLPNGEEEE